MPGPVAALEQAGTLHDLRGEVAMDEARLVVANEPRLELGQVGVVAAADVIEEGHGAGR